LRDHLTSSGMMSNFKSSAEIPVVYVEIFSLEYRVIKATRDEESTPPDRNAPSGTSATISIFVTRSSVSSTRSAHSSSLPRVSSTEKSRSHHSRVETSPFFHI